MWVFGGQFHKKQLPSVKCYYLKSTLTSPNVRCKHTALWNVTIINCRNLSLAIAIFLGPSNRNNFEIRTGVTQAIKVRKVGLNRDHTYLMPQPIFLRIFIVLDYKTLPEHRTYIRLLAFIEHVSFLHIFWFLSPYLESNGSTWNWIGQLFKRKKALFATNHANNTHSEVHTTGDICVDAHFYYNGKVRNAK